jgi:hypothetical protein
MKKYLILFAASLMFSTACEKTAGLPDPTSIDIPKPSPDTTVTQCWFVFQNEHGTDLFKPVENEETKVIYDGKLVKISCPSFTLIFENKGKDMLLVDENMMFSFNYFSREVVCGRDRMPGFFKTNGEPFEVNLEVTLVSGTVKILHLSKPKNNVDPDKAEIEVTITGKFQKRYWGDKSGVTHENLIFHFKSSEI